MKKVHSSGLMGTKISPIKNTRRVTQPETKPITLCTWKRASDRFATDEEAAQLRYRLINKGIVKPILEVVYED